MKIEVPVVLRIAIRNLLAHRTKTLIVGSLVAVAVFLLVLGNSVLDTAAASYRRSFISAFTGNLVVAGDVKPGASLLGGGGFGGSEQPPRIVEYGKLLALLEQEESVVAVSPQVLGYATVSLGDTSLGFSTLFGIDPEKYSAVFPDSITILEGRMLKPDETGLMLNQTLAKSFEEAAGLSVGAGDSLVLTGLNLSVGTSIRSVPIIGVFAFAESNPNLDFISLIDAQTVRALNGMNLQPVSPAVLSTEEQLLLAANDDLDLFGEDSLFGSDLVVDSAPPRAETAGESTGTNGGDDDQELEAGDDAWHYLIVRTTADREADAIAVAINNLDVSEPLVVMDWQTAAGPPGLFVGGIKIALNTAILLIIVVSILIIMNTLVISVSERVAEIGTIRALGGRRGFVWRMIVVETVALTTAFGALGIALSSLVLWAMSLTGLRAPNQFFRLLLGGDTLNPVISGASIVQSAFGVVLAGIVASLYPTYVALRIKPAVAMEAR